MTRSEFTAVVGYVKAALGKGLPDEALSVYFDLLGDLPFQSLMRAAKRLLLERPWPTFPTVGEFRTAAPAVDDQANG